MAYTLYFIGLSTIYIASHNDFIPYMVEKYRLGIKY